MSSVFLRIYGGLLFTLVLVFVLSGLTLTLVNGQRMLEYRHLLLHAPMELMVLELRATPAGERQQKLELWAEELEGALVLLPYGDQHFSASRLEKLRAGRVQEELTEQGSMAWLQLDQQQVLQVQLPDTFDRLLLLSLRLGRDFVEQAGDRQEAMTRLQSWSHYPIALLGAPDSAFTAHQRAQLADGHPLWQLKAGEAGVELYAQLDSGTLLRYGPIPLYQAYPFTLLIGIALFVLSAISLAIYVLVRGLERRLRKMEQAATALSRGDFDTRVSIRGTDSVGRLALAFNMMARHIQRLLGVQKEMIRGVSHELRTPVARLRFALEMIEDAPDAGSRSRFIEGMDKDIQELDQLVDEILTYAALDQGAPQIRFRQVDLPAICDQVLADHGHIQGISLSNQTQSAQLGRRKGRVDAEERYIQRAIQNLVGNACRYARSEVQVRFSCNGDTCRVDVDDDGPGIPPEKWEQLFTPFSRLDDSRTKATGGYGLGLSIVRRIMHWHHGRALVGQSPLGGARFSLVWPCRQKR